MNDGSKASSYEPSEEESDRESIESFKRPPSPNSETDFKALEPEISKDVHSEPEGKQQQQHRTKRGGLTDADDELAKLQADRRSGLKRYVSTGYREALNSMISDVRQGHDGEHEPQLSSQIAASFWSAEEKESLFRALTSKGRGSLDSISKRIRTKNEAEVQYYLGLLEDRAYSCDVEPVVSFARIPAACEISEDCERVLEAAATTLAKRADRRDVSAERERSGERWLIDEDVADEMETDYESFERHHLRTGDMLEADVNNPDGHMPGSPDSSEPDTDDEKPPTTDASHDDEGTPNPHKPKADAGETMSPAEMLLRPKSFLELSRHLFMNHSSDDERNWHTMRSISASTDSPAIFRSTLADFHMLALSLTRRLVQTSLFQATSRLRAEDARHSTHAPAPVVRELDVRTAIDVLGMNFDRTRYWATAPRRNDVQVLSRNPRYDDGRPGGRTGRHLTHDEVEAALGLPSRGPRPSTTPEPESIHDVEVWEALDDPGLDLLTDASSPEPETPEPAQDGSRPRYFRKPRKRERDRDEGEVVRAETRLLETLDRAASLAEEERMWAAVGFRAPKRARGADREVPSEAVMRGAGERGEGAERGWRDRVEFQAEWEGPEPLVREEEFVEMGERGRKGRERRGMLMDRIRERLSEGYRGGEVNGADEDAESEEAEGRDDSEVEVERTDEVEEVGESEDEEVTWKVDNQPGMKQLHDDVDGMDEEGDDHKDVKLSGLLQTSSVTRAE